MLFVQSCYTAIFASKVPFSMRLVVPLLLLVVLAAASLYPPATPPWTQGREADPQYLIQEVMLYREADSLRPVLRLPFRATVFKLDQQGPWTRVRTPAGDEGFVYGAVLSNTWVRVSKAQKLLYLYKGGALEATFSADFGYNPVADKEQRGTTAVRDHWRTPEGTFFVLDRNSQSQFYKAFLLNYPTIEDARRGLRRGLISQRDYDAILAAEKSFRRPPMNTPLGGMIEIHGKGTGAGVNWTQGCVAVRNADMDRLWTYIHVGTPVVIEP